MQFPLNRSGELWTSANGSNRWGGSTSQSVWGVCGRRVGNPPQDDILPHKHYLTATVTAALSKPATVITKGTALPGVMPLGT
jgi:hypothetical protein